MRTRIAFALFALSVLLHWPFGHAEFVYDDVDFVRENRSVQSLPAALAATLAPFPPDQPERGLYRPVTALSHAVDHGLFADDARGHHATSALLYGVVVLLVYALARTMFGAASATAPVAALLFAVHPVHTEAVDTISGRSELLALGFSLAALLVFLRATPAGAAQRRPLAAAGAVLYALGCGSKETAVLLPAVLVLHLLARDGAPRGVLAFAREAFDRVSPYVGVACLYLALRLHVLGGLGPASPVLAGLDPWARLSTMGAVLAEYLRLLVWPGVLQLDFYYQMEIGLPRSPTARSLVGWIALAVLAIGPATAAFAALRGRATSLAAPRGLWIAGVGSAFVFLLPVSHVVPIGALMAERFLFAPSLGLVLFACGTGAFVLRRLDAPRVVAIALVAVLATAGAVRSVRRAAEWRDGVKLWESLARETPEDYRPWSNVATHWIARGELANAERALLRARELEPGDAAVRTNLAIVRMGQGDLAGAEAIHRETLAADPRDVHARYNLAVIALNRDDVPIAIGELEHVLEINPNFQPAIERLAAARKSQDAARRFLLEARVPVRESEDPKLLEAWRRACRIAGDPCAGP